MSRASSLRLLVAFAAAACGDSVFQNSGNGPPIGFAASYGIWTPGPRDDGTAEVHNSYSVVGPDRKLYPTWHPPVDPVTGCSFGHDHGRDPRGSTLYAEVGPIPFGYANEQLDVYDPANPRHEDHFGHKIEWENDVLMRFGSAAAGSLFEIRDRKSTRLNSSHTVIYPLPLHDALPISGTIRAATPAGRRCTRRSGRSPSDTPTSSSTSMTPRTPATRTTSATRSSGRTTC